MGSLKDTTKKAKDSDTRPLSSSNIIVGDYNCLVEDSDHNNVKGRSNILDGNGNLILGSNNDVEGDSNIVKSS